MLASLACMALILGTVVVPIGKPTPAPDWGPEPTPTPVDAFWHRGSDGRCHLLAGVTGRVFETVTPGTEDRVAIRGGQLVTASWDGLVTQRLAIPGSPGAVARLPTNLDLAPLLTEDRVYVAGWDRRVYAMDRQGLDRVWTSPRAPGSLRARPDRWRGMVITGWGEESVAALDARDGRVAWEQPLGGRPTHITVGRWEIYVTTDTPELVALEPPGGKILARVALPAPARRPVRVEGSHLQVLCRGGTLLAFDPITLEAGWRRSIPKNGWPVLLSSLLWVVEEDLVGLDPLTGEVRYRYAEMAERAGSEILEDLAWAQDALISPHLARRVLWPFPLPLGKIVSVAAADGSALVVGLRDEQGERVDRLAWEVLVEGPILRRVWSTRIHDSSTGSDP